METLAGLQIIDWINLPAFAIEAPFKKASGRAILQLDFDTQCGGDDGIEVDAGELIGRHSIAARRTYFLPVVAVAVQESPTLGQLARVGVVVMSGPINLHGVDFFRLGKVVLHPFGSSFASEPHEAR